MLLFTSILFLRLGYLQLAQYKLFKTLSLKNQLSLIPKAPSRGLITDRNGEVIATNIPIYALEIIPERIPNLSQTLDALQTLLPSISYEDIENFHKARRRQRSFLPTPIKLKLSQEEVALFSVNQYQFPGVHIKAQLMRQYPYPEETAHIVGYVGRINQRDLEKVDSGNYRATHFIGKTGIEKFYEPLLHGKVGYEQVETDVTGRTVRTVQTSPPIAGDNLRLSLDMRIQKAAYQAMKNKRGAVVLLNVHNGDVLAMVSTPSFNSNLFVNGISHKNYNQLSQNDEKPLFDRAMRGLYPPASTIKPFMALTGLHHNTITPQSKIYDRGWFRLPHASHIYRDWKKSGHGVVDLYKAIIVSCDTYFYELSQKLGIDKIEEMMRLFGFGQKTHIDLPDEAAGIVPNDRWKRKRHKAAWYAGDTVITSIGQGFFLSSPLQLANATAALGNKGRRFRPHLIKSAESNHSAEIQEVLSMEEYPIKLNDKAHWQAVSAAMQLVITHPGGTGFRFGKNTRYTVAAKTGTAQVHSNRVYEKMKYEDIPEKLRDHSLFIAFAPADKPKVAIAVVVENDFIAPNIARKVLDSYFNAQVKPNESST